MLMEVKCHWNLVAAAVPSPSSGWVWRHSACSLFIIVPSFSWHPSYEACQSCFGTASDNLSTHLHTPPLTFFLFLKILKSFKQTTFCRICLYLDLFGGWKPKAGTDDLAPSLRREPSRPLQALGSFAVQVIREAPDWWTQTIWSTMIHDDPWWSIVSKSPWLSSISLGVTSDSWVTWLKNTVVCVGRCLQGGSCGWQDCIILHVY